MVYLVVYGYSNREDIPSVLSHDAVFENFGSDEFEAHMSADRYNSNKFSDVSYPDKAFVVKAKASFTIRK
jgi:hypothetical protein